MKQFLLLIAFLFSILTSVYSQYFFRGMIKDEKGNPLSNIKIRIHSLGRLTLSTSVDGSFGIPTRVAEDSMFVFGDGVESQMLLVSEKRFNAITLKSLIEIIGIKNNTLSSKTKNLEIDRNFLLGNIGESYRALVENDFVKTESNPETSFALNVDRAAYSNIRRFINNGIQVPVDAVRIEEMLNYFDFKDCLHQNAKQVTYKTFLTTCPWNVNSNLLFINTSFPKINLDSVPSSNLVFLIDVSGSMERPNRLPLLQAAFKMLVANLRDKDSVAIVTYGGGVDILLPSTSGKNKKVINNVIDSLVAAGDTPGAGAIRVAYNVAKQAFITNGNNRVILATDGDFNVGQSSEKELEDIIIIQKKSGIYLTCIGVGMGNYKDSKLEALAKKGNGNFAYLDNIQEAEKVLVKELTKTIYAVARDAYINIAFNKNTVKEYRLIGFENKKDAIANDSNTIVGGEVGSGHGAIAVFEIERIINIENKNELLASATLNYKTVLSDSSISLKINIKQSEPEIIDSADSNIRLATALSMYGMILKKSKFSKSYDLIDIANLLKDSSKQDNYLFKEFLGMLKKTENIYHLNKKRKKKRKSWLFF